ncbi:MAG: acyl--CoA ligase [Acidobacteriota bacterium]
MPQLETLHDLLLSGQDQATAIAAPGRPPLNFGQLRQQVSQTVHTLNGLGVGRSDAVAVVLPNGPEMASAFVSIAAAASCAPLNPAYREEEFEFYLTDLGAKLLILAQGDPTPARKVAQRLGIAIAELEQGTVSGEFSISGTPGAAQPRSGGPGQADDAALVLHTSGTTSRPKIVPLSQRNLCASARNIAQSLSLTRRDRCLNVMPLFHIHGLLAAVLSSLYAGAAVFCTPGFNALKFFSWMEEAQPTWYTAVPTMHQAILSRAPRQRELIAASPLRLIRSSSASLPPQVMKALEETFDVPVIEAYGMTEAAHQMASNPLPPRARKPGTVGVAAGPEVSVMDSQGRLLSTGRVGEVVIRGANVTSGYQGNPQANADSFTSEGWFRTGDQGVMDEDGYLRLTGRLKEIINRGGEKISPREVDEVLIDHPSVEQAVTFAMPHDKLGEEVAAAIVLNRDSAASEAEIRDFASRRLAPFKVPRKVYFMDEIPKGATGKLQRIGLAEKLGLTGDPEF